MIGGRPRLLGLGVLGALMAASVAYLAAEVPLKARPLAPAFRPEAWTVALAAFGLVVAVDALVLIAIRDRHLRTPVSRGSAAQGWIPPALIPGTVRLRGAVVTAAASIGLTMGAAALDLPLWAVAVLGLTPWLPLYVSEASWQYRHYGAYVFFGTVAVLQIGHLGEHVAQNIQLLVTHGNVAISHGIFGQLDVEAVHFYWNVIIWLGTGFLLYQLGIRNVWLWIAFVAASLHSVEHLYLYWLYVADHALYVGGGSNGIMALGGLIGSPLARPYLHLVYNVVEVTPFVLAFWDQSRMVYDRLPLASAPVAA